MNKHPHDELIRAWLDGRPVQYRQGDLWLDLEPASTVNKLPHFYRDWEYRRKPEVLRLRVWQDDDGGLHTVTSQRDEFIASGAPTFRQWVSEWITHTTGGPL